MNELSLFTGAGGGLLGTKLLGWKHIGYVEINDYCQRIIAQRIKDGILDEAPIFSDIKTFISEGFAASYKGMVDVITAGFPCQPFSVAGKRQGEDDERNMWPATIDCIRRIRPRFAFLENVPGLLTSGYFGTITGDLVESGYDIRWRILSAAEVGAPHLRDRVWIVAYTSSICKNATNSDKIDGNITRYGSSEVCGNRQQPTSIHKCSEIWTEKALQKRLHRAQGMDDGLADYMVQVIITGEGQVPAVVATAWRLLTEDLL